MLRPVLIALVALAALVLLQSVTHTICLARDRAAPAAPVHAAASPPPPSMPPPLWMAQSPLIFNSKARLTFHGLAPARETTLHVTLATVGMADWVHSWREHATAVGIAPLIVGAADATMLELCEARWKLASVGLANATTPAPAQQYVRHHSSFLRMGLLKVRLLVALLTPGFSVLMSDLDVIWLGGDWREWMLPPARNVTARYAAEAALLHHADVLVSTDELDALTDAADLTKGPGDLGWHSYGMRCELNTGIMYFRGGARGALALAHAWGSRIAHAIATRTPSHDQVEFLQLVRGAHVASVSKDAGVWAAWVADVAAAAEEAPSPRAVTAVTRDVFRSADAWPTHERCADAHDLAFESDGACTRSSSTGAIHDDGAAHWTIGTLPAAHFASGHYWFAQAGWADERVAAPRAALQALHLTFGFGDGADGPHGKRQRAREAGMWWADDDRYYGMGSNELFLRLHGQAYDEAERVVIDAAHPEHSPQRHVELAAVQLRTVLELLALAAALNATLIMPPLLCACDRYWGLLRSCRHPDAPPSMRLPFRCPMDSMLDVARWQASGVRFREAGFLSNLRIPPDVHREVVRVVARSNAGRAREGSAEARFAVALPPGAPMAQVLPQVRAANPGVRVVEIGLDDLRRLVCTPRGGAAFSTAGAFEERAVRALLTAPSIAFCPAEMNLAFPGWSRWDGNTPPLNCSRGLAPTPVGKAEHDRVCAT